MFAVTEKNYNSDLVSDYRGKNSLHLVNLTWILVVKMYILSILEILRVETLLSTLCAELSFFWRLLQSSRLLRFFETQTLKPKFLQPWVLEIIPNLLSWKWHWIEKWNDSFSGANSSQKIGIYKFLFHSYIHLTQSDLT